MVVDLSKLGKRKEKEGVSPHHIVFEFVDDHEVSGAKVDVRDVTPEQVFVAVGHLNRIAMMLLGQRDAVAKQAELEAMAVQQQLAREQKGN